VDFFYEVVVDESTSGEEVVSGRRAKGILTQDWEKCTSVVKSPKPSARKSFGTDKPVLSVGLDA